MVVQGLRCGDVVYCFTSSQFGPKKTKKFKYHVEHCADKDVVDPVYFDLDHNWRENGVQFDTFGEQLIDLITVEELKLFLERINNLYDDVGGIVDLQMDFESVEMEKPKEGGGKQWEKMNIQNGAIMGVLKDICDIDNDHIYLEFGAGNGKVSQCVNKYFNTDHILIDFGTFKHKAKPVQRDRENFFWELVKIDIKDLMISKIPQVEEYPNRKLVGYSKHLCGVATDYTIACILNDMKNSNHWHSMVISLCCHHKCKWSQYSNQEFFTEHGFSPEEFKIIQKITSWGTFYSTEENKEELQNEDWTGLSLKSKEKIGRKCKELIDIGRLHYLKNQGFNCTLKKYVEKEISPENILLIINF